jgi:hypothetical protein
VICIRADKIPAKPFYESLKDNDKTTDGAVTLQVIRDFAKSLACQERMETIVHGCQT